MSTLECPFCHAMIGPTGYHQCAISHPIATPTGATALAMEIDVLRQLLAKKDAEIVRLANHHNSCVDRTRELIAVLDRNDIHECDSAACNCGDWHNLGSSKLLDRMREREAEIVARAKLEQFEADCRAVCDVCGNANSPRATKNSNGTWMHDARAYGRTPCYGHDIRAAFAKANPAAVRDKGPGA